MWIDHFALLTPKPEGGFESVLIVSVFDKPYFASIDLNTSGISERLKVITRELLAFSIAEQICKHLKERAKHAG